MNRKEELKEKYTNYKLILRNFTLGQPNLFPFYLFIYYLLIINLILIFLIWFVANESLADDKILDWEGYGIKC